MAGMFDDLMSYLMGGTGLGNMLGVGGPTASTQTPAIVGPLAGSPQTPSPPVATGPMLGGTPPPNRGLLAGLLGGGQPVNPMSYFQPRPGLLGDSPLGNMLRGGMAGLGAGAGVGGLTGLGVAAQGGQQAVQQRRQQEMTTALAGQQYQQGQQGLISGAIANQSALMHVNNIREFNGLAPVTMAELVANPDLVSNPTGSQGQAPNTGQAPVAPPVQPQASVVPTMTQVDPHLQQAQPQGTTAGPPPQTAVATQYPNQHGIIVPRAAPPTTTLPRATTVTAATAQLPKPDPATLTAPGQTTATPPAAAQGGIPMVGGAASAPPTTAAPASQAGGGGFPQTRAEIEASNLPDWAKQSLIMAHLSGDYGEISKVETDLGKYFGTAGQAAASTTATGLATEQLPATKRGIVGDLTKTFEGDQAYKDYHQVKPAYDAGMKAYNTLGHGGSAYDLINAAIQAAGGAGVVKPGVATSVSDIATIPAQIQAYIQKFSTSGNPLDQGVADQLRGILENHMAVVQGPYDNLLGNMRVQANSYLGSGVNERLWRHDTPPPPPPTQQGKDAGGNITTFVLNGGTYDPVNDKWSGGKWVPR